MPAIEPDYDSDPGRFLAWRPREDVHRAVGDRVGAEGLWPLLDLGCGDGRLREAVGSAPGWLGVDRSRTLLRQVDGPVVLGDACMVPAASGSVGAVAALWMLYHLDDPSLAIAEARRVLRPAGLFVASASRRDDSPELCAPSAPSTFDAEEAGDVVAAVFGEVEVEAWDAPLVTLRDREEVRRYLVQQMGDPRRAADVEVPVTVTKRGCLVWARKT